MARLFVVMASVVLLLVSACLLPRAAHGLPTNSLLDRPRGKNNFFVCLPQQGFCCAAQISGFLFPSYVDGVCVSMSRCLANGTLVRPAPGLWQDMDCTVRVTQTSEIPDCTGHIQTTQVNVIQNYIRESAAYMQRPQLLQLLVLVAAALVAIPLLS